MLGEAVSLRSPKDLQVVYYWSPDSWADVSEFLIELSWSETKDQVARQFTLVFDDYASNLGRLVNGGVVVIRYTTPRATREWFRGTVIIDRRLEDAAEATKTLTVQDPMRVVGASDKQFTFVKGRTADESIVRILKDLRVPIGSIYKCSKKLAGLTYQGKAIDAINVLLLKARQAGDPRLVPEWSGGKFHLVRYREPVWTWDLSTVLQRVESQSSIENVITKVSLAGQESLTVPTTTGAGRAKRASTRKQSRTTRAVATANAERLLAFGVIEISDTVDDSNASPSQIAKRAKQRLAQGSKPENSLSVTLPFEALTLRRLQPVSFPDKDGPAGATGKFYVSALSGSISAREASMTLELTKGPDFPAAPTSSLAFTEPGTTAAGGPAPEGLEVKGRPATAEQKANMVTAYQVATELKAPELAIRALFAACIDESSFQNLEGGHSSSVGILQLLDTHLGGSTSTKGGRRDVALVIRLFLTQGFTGQGGAIALARSHPDWSPAKIADAVQGPRDGAAVYVPFIAEADANIALLS